MGQPMLRSGESLAELLPSLTSSPPAAVLFNCSQPEVMDDAVREAVMYFANHTNPPQIGVLANAFPLMKKVIKGRMTAYMNCRVILHRKPMQILPSNGPHQGQG